MLGYALMILLTPHPQEPTQATGETPPAATKHEHAPIPAATIVPGQVFAGRYRIATELGRGGMGHVYRADDLELGVPVALKFLPPQYTSDARRLERMRDEVRIARQISHPSVCRVFDITTAQTPDGPCTFFTMEFIDGEDLSSLLRRVGRLTAEKGPETARQVCLGLASMHDQGLVHRDLKPGNIMIDGKGRARLTDFGISIFADRSLEAGSAGTPQYMAPEVLAGGAATTGSDMFALGLVLYELFTGRCPVPRESVYALIEFHKYFEISSPATLVSDLDPAVAQIIMKCVSKEPGQRPATAIVVAAALPGGEVLQAAIAAGNTPSAELATAAPTSVRRQAKRNDVPWVAIGLSAAALATVTIATIAIALNRGSATPSSAPPAVPHTPDTTPAESQQATSNPVAAVLVPSLTVTESTDDAGKPAFSVMGTLLNDGEIQAAKARINAAGARMGTVKLDTDPDTVRRVAEQRIATAGIKGVIVDLRRRTSTTIPPSGPHFLIVRHPDDADVKQLRSIMAEFVLEPDRWVEYQRMGTSQPR